MQLINKTPYPAKLFRTSIDDHRLAASLVVRVTYEWKNDRFEPADEQDWIVSAGAWETPYGLMPGDELFFRGGVDLFLLGRAQPRKGEVAASLDVEIEVGAFRYAVRVFGDRVWQRTRSGLVASAPRPIASVPLTLQHAFGGKGKWDGLDVPYAPNPAGKGFYIDEDSAEGGALPNIEDPRSLIVKWDDRPMPVGMGVCPMEFPGRMLELVNPETQQWEFSEKLFNAAFPGMVAPKVAPGNIIIVRGVSPTGQIKLPVPNWQFQVRLTFDEEVVEKVLSIDQVGLEFEKRRVFVSYRYPFRYGMQRMQRRSCTLTSLGCPA